MSSRRHDGSSANIKGEIFFLSIVEKYFSFTNHLSIIIVRKKQITDDASNNAMI